MANFSSNTQIPQYPLRSTSHRKLVCLFFCCFFGFISLAQTTPSTSSKANKLFSKAEAFIKQRDFSSGIEYYKKAIQKDKQFAQAYKRLAMSYEVLREMDSSFYYYDRYLAMQGIENMSQASAFFLIETYLQRGRYQKADSLLNAFPVVDSGDPKYTSLRERIDFALEGIREAKTHTYEVLSDSVNRFHSQYFPTVTVDNSQLIFTQRAGPSLQDDEDLMISYQTPAGWSPAEQISPLINSRDNEGASTISADGRTLIFTSCDEKNSFGSCDLFISFKTGSTWSKPRNLGPTVNSIYWDSQPSLSADGSVLYFSSNRPGGQGGRDLWIATYQNDQWTKPVNAGQIINTSKDEVTPYLHFNNETLFFSSTGHLGYGGYDLFKLDLSDSLADEPTNLGFGINNHLDQISMVIGADGTYGYFAQEYIDHSGNRRSKLSRVLFDESSVIEKKAVFVTGYVVDKFDQQPVKAEITLYDLNDEGEEDVYITQSDGLTGGFYFVLTQGSTYGVFVKADGYLFEDFSFDVVSKEVSQPDSLFIELQPLAADAQLTLENIYFEFDSYDLSDQSRSELAAIGKFIVANPIFIEISGHTDSRGNEEYNMSLSEKRASAVYAHLVDLGVSKDKISFRGYGSEELLLPADPQSPQNRRIDFKILKVLPSDPGK